MAEFQPRLLLRFFLPLVFLALAPLLGAHQPGNSSLVLRIDETGQMTGEYHVADVDLESINLMLEDRARRSGASTPAAADLPWMRLTIDGQPRKVATGPATEVVSDSRPHTMIPFAAGAVDGDQLEVAFADFFAFDPQHRVVLSLESAGEPKVGLLTLDEPRWTVSVGEPGAWSQFLKFTWEGVWHIWIGIDHILFLIALLLPSVLHFRHGRWEPVHDFREALVNVLKVVTAFTVAHSVTLSLAALQIVSLPSKLVESVIAISVVLAALNNIFPVVRDRAWAVAFGFGLIHGFGFANVLADLHLPAQTLAIALLSFNIGVELGQLAIVSVFFPLSFSWRGHALYQPIKLKLGSALISFVAGAWIVERVFEVSILPF